MAYKHITDSTATQVESGYVSKGIIQVNAALTGSITVYDAIGSATTPVVAVITNPTVGTRYEFWDLMAGFKVTASGSCDITCSSSGTNGQK
jgi:hypothetical protein